MKNLRKIAIILMLSVFTQNIFAYPLGDVDLDGNVTAKDASLVLQYVLNTDSIDFDKEQKSLALVTKSEEISSSDAAFILQRALNADTVFPNSEGKIDFNYKIESVLGSVTGTEYFGNITTQSLIIKDYNEYLSLIDTFKSQVEEEYQLSDIENTYLNQGYDEEFFKNNVLIIRGVYRTATKTYIGSVTYDNKTITITEVDDSFGYMFPCVMVVDVIFVEIPKTYEFENVMWASEINSGFIGEI